MIDFLAAHGGPFYEAQRRLGLLDERSLRIWPRAGIFVAIAWGVPLALSAMDGYLLVPSGGGFLQDIAVWARFVLATGLLVIAEGQVEPRLQMILTRFTTALVEAPSLSACAEAVATALRRRDSAVAEGMILAIAVAVSLFSVFTVQEARSGSWAANGTVLTLAGWWCVLVSSPILWFLLLRGLWRHLVWAMLLYALSKEKLRLIVTHPDGKAGIAFVGRYPNAYAIFILGVSCIIGAALARQLQDGALAASTIGIVMAGWLALVFAHFVAPLTAFSVILAKLKDDALAVYGDRATAALRLAERNLVGGNVAAPESPDAEGEKGLPDPSKSFEAARKMSILMLDRSALLPLAAAALLPLAIAGIGKLPYKELLSTLKKLLLL